VGVYDELVMWLKYVGYKEYVHNFGEETTRERPLGRPKCRLENNIEERLGREFERVGVAQKWNRKLSYGGFRYCGTETSGSPTRECFLETKTQVKDRISSVVLILLILQDTGIFR
jgi:hypothetical protein